VPWRSGWRALSLGGDHREAAAGFAARAASMVASAPADWFGLRSSDQLHHSRFSAPVESLHRALVQFMTADADGDVRDARAGPGYR